MNMISWDLYRQSYNGKSARAAVCVERGRPGHAGTLGRVNVHHLKLQQKTHLPPVHRGLRMLAPEVLQVQSGRSKCIRLGFPPPPIQSYHTGSG